jgi:hypothetical protein
MQLSFGMEAGVRPQNTVVNAWGTDENSEAIAYIDAVLPKFRATGTVRDRAPARPVAYLYTRQAEDVDPPIRISPEWIGLRPVTPGEPVPEWLRLTGERSTWRTEVYGDTRTRWKGEAKWTEKPGMRRLCWALDRRRMSSGAAISAASGDLGEATRRTVGALGLPDGLIELRAAATLTTVIHPLVLIAGWLASGWMPTAIETAKRVVVTDRTPRATDLAWIDAWTVEVEKLGLVGHPHHEAIVLATIERASANPVIVRALIWAWSMAVAHA